jgi:hypothetical protein
MTAIDTHGAWVRRSVMIDDGPSFETQFVIWLQAGSCYADVRVPLHPDADERCFAGRSGWDGEGYRWTHHFDLEPGSPAADDIGLLVWDHDALIERGVYPTLDGSVRYEETWIPLDGSDGPYLAAESASEAFVRVGDHAIGISDRRAGGGVFAAAYWCHRDGAWRVGAAIEDSAGLAHPDRMCANGPGWLVVERGEKDALAAGAER